MISVIVPYWNAEKWLGRCCESLLKQEGEFEFLLISDHCTDNSDDIARDYACKDKRFTVIWNTHAKGVSGARNTGLDVARGEWVTFLDADDELMPDAYAAFTSTIRRDPKADIHQLNHIRYYTAISKKTIKYTNNAGRYDKDNLPDIWWCVWNKVIRRGFLKGIRFNEGLQYGEDGLFILECLAKGAYINHAERNVVAVMHRFGNKKSLSHVKTVQDIIKQIREYEAFLFRHASMRQLVALEISKLWERVSREWT